MVLSSSSPVADVSLTTSTRQRTIVMRTRKGVGAAQSNDQDQRHFFLAPTDGKAAFREDIADTCNLPGMVLHPHRQAIVHIPTTSKTVGRASCKRQRQDSQGRGITALIRNAAA